MRDAVDHGKGSPRHPPLSAGDIERLAARAFDGLSSAILAVSGGADSMTLLLLAQAWRAAGHSLPILVATVDHGLRPESGKEAQWVGSQARAAGFEHRGLVWDAAKPTSGIQEAAREARYGLLVALAERERLPGPTGILLAHHLDDQAETFLMRLQRGSGLDGLAAMPERRPLDRQNGIVLVRPFLEISKARLIATLQAQGITWLEDPSNANPAFERVRVRQALAGLEALGIGAEEIGTAARRLGRARLALEEMTDETFRLELDLHGGAFGRMSTASFDRSSAELQLRVVQRLVAMFGEPGGRPRLARIEALTARLASDYCTGTLSGCRLSRDKEAVVAVREPGRRGLPCVELAPGETVVWDGRFRLSLADGYGGPVTVRALTPQELAGFRRQRTREGDAFDPVVPRDAMLTLPSVWCGDRLLGVAHPLVGPAFPDALQGVEVRFVAG